MNHKDFPHPENQSEDQRRYQELLFSGEKINLAQLLTKILTQSRPDALVFFGRSAKKMWDDLEPHIPQNLLESLRIVFIPTQFDDNPKKNYELAAQEVIEQIQPQSKILVLEDFIRGGYKIETLWKNLSTQFQINIITLAIQLETFARLTPDMGPSLTALSNKTADVRSIDFRDL